MKVLKKSLVIGTSSVMALSGIGGVAFAATQSNSGQDVPMAEEQAAQQIDGVEAVQVDQVIGEFAYTQAEVTANDVIKKNLGDASQYLCGSRPVAEGEASVESWEISVNGRSVIRLAQRSKNLLKKKAHRRSLWAVRALATPQMGAQA